MLLHRRIISLSHHPTIPQPVWCHTQQNYLVFHNVDMDINLIAAVCCVPKHGGVISGRAPRTVPLLTFDHLVHDQARSECSQVDCKFS